MKLSGSQSFNEFAHLEILHFTIRRVLRPDVIVSKVVLNEGQDAVDDLVLTRAHRVCVAKLLSIETACKHCVEIGGKQSYVVR